MLKVNDAQLGILLTNLRPNNLVFCEICGECLGIERPNYAKEHLMKFPEHRRFLVKNMIDPLKLPNPDEWFLKKSQTPKLNTKKFTDETPEDEQNLKYTSVQQMGFDIIE